MEHSNVDQNNIPKQNNQQNFYPPPNPPDNSAQYQPLYILPPTSPQNIEEPREKPYFSSENPNTNNSNPSNTPQNDYPSQEQPYYAPLLNQDISPNKQQNAYLNNRNKYIPPVLDTQYQKYSNISQIPHKGISQPKPNTFYVSTGCCLRITAIILFLIGAGLIVFPFIIKAAFITILPGLFFLLMSLCWCFGVFNAYFIMGPNNLKVIKKSMLWRKTMIYNPGELLEVNFSHKYSYDYKKRSNNYSYGLSVNKSNGKTDFIFSIGSNSVMFTDEEIDYFLYHINTHIQTKMRN